MLLPWPMEKFEAEQSCYYQELSFFDQFASFQGWAALLRPLFVGVDVFDLPDGNAWKRRARQKGEKH